MMAVSESTPLDKGRRLGSPELRRLVERYVRRRVPEADVDDVVQTVLCDAVASDRQPDDSEELRRWLIGVTRHKVADFHRKTGRARHVELPEQIEGEAPPLEARDWARWASEQTAGDSEAQRTLDWMAREGGGEKLAHIAKDEQLPPAQVRQRVSRLRRSMKQRWLAELAAVAVLGVAVLVAWRWLRQPTAPIAPRPAPEAVSVPRPSEVPERRARELRAEALQRCQSERWTACLEGLDVAAQLDPAGDAAAEVQAARKRIGDALAKPPEPAPSGSVLAPEPVPTSQSQRKGPPPQTTSRRKAPPPNLKKQKLLHKLNLKKGKSPPINAPLEPKQQQEVPTMN